MNITEKELDKIWQHTRRVANVKKNPNAIEELIKGAKIIGAEVDGFPDVYGVRLFLVRDGKGYMLSISTVRKDMLDLMIDSGGGKGAVWLLKEIAKEPLIIESGKMQKSTIEKNIGYISTADVDTKGLIGKVIVDATPIIDGERNSIRLKLSDEHIEGADRELEYLDVFAD